MSTQPQFRPSLVSPPKPKRPSRRIYIALFLFVVLVAAAWFYSSEERRIDVQITSPVRQDIASTVSSAGVVLPVRDFQVRANFPGIVEDIYVHVGQQVRAGQMLVQMKDQYAVPRLDTALAALRASQLTLRNAEQNGSPDDQISYTSDLNRAKSERDSAESILTTLQKLEKRGSASEAEVLNAAQRLNASEANLNKLIERHAHRYSPEDIQSLSAKVRADRDSVAAERISWANANISTPIAGTVYIIPVSPYDFVPAGGELMHVADLSQLEVRSNFYEPDIGKLQIGQPVTIQWEGAPGETWMGKVIARPMAIDRSGPLTVGQCIIALTSPTNDLPVNSSVSVLVQSQKHANALTIPREALYGISPNQFVFRIVDGRLRKTPVKTGVLNAMTAEITSGLTEHDTVALRAEDGSRLSDRRRVEAAQNH